MTQGFKIQILRNTAEKPVNIHQYYPQNFPCFQSKFVILKLFDPKHRESQCYFNVEDKDGLATSEDDKLKECKFIKFKAYGVGFPLSLRERSKGIYAYSL